MKTFLLLGAGKNSGKLPLGFFWKCPHSAAYP